MSHSLFTQVKVSCRWMTVLVSALCLSGCVSLAKQTAGNSDDVGLATGKHALRQVIVEKFEDSVDLILQGDAGIKLSAVKEDFPLSVMLYLHDTAFSPSFTLPNVFTGTPFTSILTSYADEEERVAVLNVLLKENLEFKAVEQNDQWRISFFPQMGGMEMSEDHGASRRKISIKDDELEPSAAPDASVVQKKKYRSLSKVQEAQYSKLTEKIKPQDGLFHSGSHSLDQQAHAATLNSIDFQSDANGETAIVIHTSHQVQYKIEKSRVNDQELQLTLLNTAIPEKYQKRISTTEFSSAVDEILPVNRFNENEPSRILFQLKKRVPYHLLQEERKITLYIEPVGMVEASEHLEFSPHLLEDPLISTGEKEAGYAVADDESQDAAFQDHIETDTMAMATEFEDVDVASGNDQVDDELMFDKPKEYTGEKISLDFYETDIKNVFRILRTVSGDNFAIDKDVTGSVTLTLDKPVPWDQILDLILKMNGLGMVREGAIIRIATLATLQSEEQARQAMFEARKKALEQQRELEPLVTEYIPINYANAENDIKPHLERLLKDGGEDDTDRGELTADSRTNMIILTDTQEKIDLAKEIIYRLDKVTPQIMISARIVEANKDFSRELGVSWNVSSEDVYRDDIGGLYGFDIAMNYPVDSTNGIGYTFSRLAGTPLLLDAKLNASELTGNSKIISSPKILTLDNRTAKIDQGVDYGYQSGVDENGNPVISFKQATISLEVTPQVTPDNRVGMIVKISKNDITGTVAGIPSLSTNEAETELLVNDGNTIVIGGIVKTNYSESKNAFPFLGDIPYVGKLFSSDTTTNNRDELLIFITPTIVQLDQRENIL